VVHQLEHLVLVLREVVLVLVVVVAAVAQPVLSVRVAHAAHQRLESLRE
jgi:multisubunit Na+/H+ antiporter MnhG subunit